MAGERLLYRNPGAFATVTVLQGEGSYKELRVNDVPEVPTDYGCLQAFHALGHLPCLTHGSPERALVLCFGAGITTGAISIHGLERIDAVEVCPDVVEANLYFFEENRHVLADDRVRLILEEGRSYLSRSGDSYDLIACDSTHPRSGDSWMLYTREFYELCLRRLRPGGVLCQWLPIHGLKPSEYKRVVRTFLSVFPDTTLWFLNRFTLLLGGGRSSLIDFGRFARGLKGSGVREDLRPYHLEDACAFLSWFVAGGDDLPRYADGAEIITDRAPLPRGSTPERLATDTKPLNLAELCAIRREVASILRGAPAAARNKLKKYHEAREHSLQGRIFCFQGRYERERECYLEALKALPGDRDTRVLLREAEWNLLLAEGKKSVEEGALEKACKLYRKGLRADGHAGAALYNLGVVHLKMGRYDRAVRYFRGALQTVPWNAEAHYHLAAAYWNKGKEADCRAELERALELEPRMEKARRALARLGREDAR
ncbi:MAG: tetratricopeptide repeat protein [bacterium]